MLPAARQAIGPDGTTLRVHTYKDGVAARAGHDLVIEVGIWDAVLEDGALTVTVDPRSLCVLEARNGLKPLSEKDRRDIEHTIDTKILRAAPIRFRSTAIDGARVTGELELAGRTHALSFEVLRGDDGSFSTVAEVTQTLWGIKPYSAMMGTLKVRDTVEIVACGTFPAP